MNVAVMGYGTIGSGVVEVLTENADVITSRVGFPIEVKKVLDLRDFSKDPLIGTKLTADYKEIVNDPDIDIVVETMGGVEPAYTFVKEMLLAGKHVTTSNKALVAAKGAELMQIAKDKKVSFTFEASVGGGIPIIRPMFESMAGDVIDLIEGIVNGTTNFILTKMSQENMEFDAALELAQKNGFAEADPTNDIDGFDATRKIAILTSIASGHTVDFEEIDTVGIRNISSADIKYAAKMNRDIKLIARASRKGDSYVIRVAPYLMDRSHPLSFVSGVFNAIFVRGNMLGDSMFYGSGAGKLPTASAVVGDVIDMARNVEKNTLCLWDDKKLAIADASSEESHFFIRTKEKEEQIEKVFSHVTYVEAGVSGERGFITTNMKEKELSEALKNLGSHITFIRLA